MDTKNQQNNFNNPVVIILVLALVGLGGYLLFSKNSNNNLSQDQVPQNTAGNSQQDQIDALNKTVEDLKNAKPKTIVKEIPAPQPVAKADLQTVIKQWEPYVAYVDCKFSNTNSLYYEDSGSGILYFNPEPNPGFDILTNKHVIQDSQGYGADSCSIQFPNYDNNVITTTNDGTLNSFSLPKNGADAGFIVINNPDSYISNMKNNFASYCKTMPNLGDKVVMLGFPAIGSPTGITVTQGIISGYDGDYFITDAKIDHGNSGGVAINIEDNCYLGLPTWAATGQIESLARILKWQAIHN